MNKPTCITCLLFILAALLGVNTASAQCEAGFSFTADTVCAGESVAFADTSKGTGPITYLWDFGDAGSPSNFSNQQHATHSFVSTGTLTVKLIITDSINCSDTFSMQVVVLPTPIVSFNRYNNCKQTLASFINTSTAGSDTVADWKWYFSATDSSSQKNPTYTFGDTGSYIVTLIGTTVLGCTDTAVQTVRVYSKPMLLVEDTQFCAGTSINFDAQVQETSGVSYAWRFGDNTSATTKQALHIYNNGGIYKPIIKITHGGTDSCFARFDSLTVFDLPVVNFNIANDTLCYDGNNGCVQDLTGTGPFGGAITLRTVVFGDGFIDNTTPLSTTTICHSYSDPAGGAYPVTIEATDANQCFARKQVAKAIVVLPDFEPDFTMAETKDCFSTRVDLTNTSAFDSTRLSEFAWVFGDGDTAFSGWSAASHLYTSTGNYSIQLLVTDTSGCPAIKTSATAVEAVVVNFNPSVNRDTSCFFGNLFGVSNPINAGAAAIWSFGDGASADSAWTTSHSYQNPGNYIIRLRIQAPSCDSTKIVDTVTVLGPRANIGNPVNRFQCMIHDTVYFVGNGALYMSNHGPAPGNVQRLWHFDDPAAPQCTTDTKNGINVGMNCNFSRDSLAVKHWYTPGSEGCYRPRLYLEDTTWGCLDTSFTYLALQRPKAAPDSTAVPPIPGLIFTQPDCLGPEGIKTKVALLANTQPSCARDRFWVMWDSTCAAQSGSFNSFWSLNDSFHNWQYVSPPCDTGGKVTIGLIIRNGEDTAGNFCFDTAWYHNILDFNDLYPFITHDFNPAISRCPGTTVNFRITDTLQDGITFYSWDFKDGSPVVSGPSLYKTSHTFNQRGVYDVELTITNADGCTGSHIERITIGFTGDFAVSAGQGCAGDALEFTEDVLYYDIGSLHWLNPARQAASKETLWWDFGDGRGFATQGSRPTVVFNKVGTYTVKLALKDSSGCVDTIVKPNLFTIYGTYARFTLDDTIVCPQLLQLKDSSRVFDPDSFVNIPAGDSISKWEWVFNNGPKSFIKNPFFDFGAGGDYNIKLKVENLQGCVDSTEHDVYVKGPIPLFSIVGDSAGCSPLKVIFKNESVNANKYTWSFNDAALNTLTTLSDTNVHHIYTGGGVFQPFLTAESSEFDSKKGITVTCRATYPDTSLGVIRVISVQGTPVARFGNSNACSNFTLNFTDSSTIDSGAIAFYQYDFGDGATSSLQNPSHTFADTGTYTVTQVVTSSSGCQDTFVKVISIAPPPGAVFTYRNTCHGQITEFFDSSTTNNAFVIRWEWSFGDGTTSVLTAPAKQYLVTGPYTVKLKILTNAGCADSIEKTISVNPRPVVDFTAPATCMLSGAAMVNSSAISTGNIAGYTWNFGDGDTASAVNPVHAYTAAGTFNIRLTAISDSGCRDSVARSITIYPKPVVAFVVSNPQQCVNAQNFIFTDNSTVTPGAPLSTLWDFGDGNTSTNPAETHIYSAAGIYQLRLVTTSGDNCADTGFRDIYVFPKPVAGFTVNDTEQCVNNNSFVFTNTSVDTGSLAYFWDFGNGATTSAVNPIGSFFVDTIFPIRLVAQNGNNCRDTVTEYIRVLPAPSASFTINDT
ncbi:MAG TPA: PKD domain-containing protein, partial [Bacteroidia bacterium]|nr:PKD domain-containing protein [Bacteroidia bacterium]